MKIHLNNIPDIKELEILLIKAGFTDRTTNQIKKAFSNSRYIVSITDNGVLVGIGRAFGDEVDCVVICDVVVSPEKRKHGIGTMILKNLTKMISHHMRIILYANLETEEFYKLLGFQKMDTVMVMWDYEFLNSRLNQ